eukprot:g857.t1
MSFGSYRLSVEEQKANAIKTAKDARVQRIIEVRKQDKLNNHKRNKTVKSVSIEADLLVEQQAELDWKRNQSHYQQILLRQHICELKCMGTAQTNAKRAALEEISNKKEHNMQQQCNERLKLHRYKTAINVLRNETKQRTLRVHRLVVKRSNEKENARLLARQYAKAEKKQPKSLQEANMELYSFKQLARNHNAIDFKFSRAHEGLDVPISVLKPVHTDQTTASENAEFERRRLKCMALQQKQRQATADGRARDRGEVALLRERAIIQRQVFEAHLKSEDRAIRKAQQIQVTNTVRSSMQCRNNNASIESCEKQLRKILHLEASLPKPSTTSLRQTRKRLKPVKSPLQDRGVHTGVQTTSLVSDDKEDTRINACTSGDNFTSSKSSAEERHVETKEDPKLPTISKTGVEASTQTQTYVELEQREQEKDYSVSVSVDKYEQEAEQKNTFQTDNTVIPQALHDFIETQSNFSMTLSDHTNSFDELSDIQSSSLHSYDFASNSSKEADSHLYEDSLSEALSLETDVFMQRYLQSRDTTSDTFTSSDQSSLSNLRSLLSESEYSSLSMVPEDDSEEFEESMLSSGGVALSLSDLLSSSATTATSQHDDDNNNHNHNHNNGLRVNQILDSLTDNCLSLNFQARQDNTRNSDSSGYSLILDTIREENDTEHFSQTGNSSLKSEDSNSDSLSTLL